MPYVPPHLRGKQSESAAPEPSSSSRAPEGGSSGFPRTPSYGNRLDSYDRRGDGGYGRQGSSGLPRSGSTQSFNRAPIEPVFSTWQPTSRVLSLSDDTIAEIRQRLKVTVEDRTDGEKAAPPIESFAEMVRRSGP